MFHTRVLKPGRCRPADSQMLLLTYIIEKPVGGRKLLLLIKTPVNRYGDSIGRGGNT